MTEVLSFSPLVALRLAPRIRRDSGLAGDPVDGDAFQLHFNDLPRARWERMTEAVAAPLQQSWAYGEAMRALGAEILRVRLRDERTRRDVALAQFVIRRWLGRPRLALASRGPVWLTSLSGDDQANAMRRIQSAPLLTEDQLAWPRLGVVSPDSGTPSDVMTAAGMRKVFTGPTHVDLDLRPSESALRSAMQVKWRNRLKAAERSALKVRVFEPRFDSYGWLLEADAAQQEQRGYAALPPVFASLYHQIAGGASVRLAFAEDGGARAAAMLFLLHGRRATYHIGWTGPLGRQNGAHNQLLWHAMLSLKADGVDAVDLGGVDTGRGAGLARFKLGTGGRLAPLPGAFA